MSQDAAIKATVKQFFDQTVEDSMADLRPLMDPAKTPRVKGLLQEIANLKLEQLQQTNPEDRKLYEEMIRDKWASLEHVLDSERIVKERALAQVIRRVFTRALTTAATICTALIKAGVKSAVMGATGGLSEPLAALLEPALDNALDKGAAKLLSALPKDDLPKVLDSSEA